MKKTPLYLLLLILLGACRSYPIPPAPTYDDYLTQLLGQPIHAAGFATGTLLFVHDQSGNMDSAIQSSTGRYTHVAVLEHSPKGYYVYEALPRTGVVRHTLEQFVQQIDCDGSGAYPIDFFRPTIPFDTAGVLQGLHAHLGQPYDPYFLPDNQRTYCSELVYETYRDMLGQPLFELQPMNFLDSLGALPRYWRDHFDSLGVEVPQGVPGTNPNDLSKSPNLQIFLKL